MEVQTIEALAEQVLRNNTSSNAVQSIAIGNFDNLLKPVWKYSQHEKRSSSVSRIPTMVWNQIKPFTSLLQIDSIPATEKFAPLWSNFSPDILSVDTPITKISEFISILEKRKEAWTKNADAQGVLTSGFCALTKTSPEIFGCDWTAAGELQPSLGASLWTAAVTTLGCSFKLTCKITLTKKEYS